MKKHEEKDTNKKKSHKTRNLILLGASILVILATAIVLLLIFLRKDSERDEYEVKHFDTQEIYNDAFIKGVSTLKTDGKFTYRLDETQMNELLHNSFNSIKDKADSHVENVYFKYEEDNTCVYYLDLKDTFVKSRIRIETEQSPSELLGGFRFKINKISMGKVNSYSYVQRKGYISNEFFDLLFENAGLPFTMRLDREEIMYQPPMFLNNVNLDGDLFSYLKANMLKTGYFILPESIGFSYDLNHLRSNDFDEHIPFVNEYLGIHDLVKESFVEENLNDIAVGETREIVSFSLNEINSSLNCINKQHIIKERYTSSISNSFAELSISEVSLKNIDDKNLELTYFVDVGKFVFDVNLDISISEGSNPNNFELIGKIDIHSDYLNERNVVSNKLFNNLINNIDCITLNPENYTFKFSLKDIIDNSGIIGISFYNCSVKLTGNSLVFTASK